MRRPGSDHVRESFSEAHSGDLAIRPARKRKSPPPYSIRFTAEERAILKRDAGKLSEAAYIRKKLFENEPCLIPRLTRKRHSPDLEMAVISELLGALGQSQLSTNLNEIAKAASAGALPVSPELELELSQASAAILAMKEALITALGVKPR